MICRTSHLDDGEIGAEDVYFNTKQEGCMSLGLDSGSISVVRQQGLFRD